MNFKTQLKTIFEVIFNPIKTLKCLPSSQILPISFIVYALAVYSNNLRKGTFLSFHNRTNSYIIASLTLFLLAPIISSLLCCIFFWCVTRVFGKKLTAKKILNLIWHSSVPSLFPTFFTLIMVFIYGWQIQGVFKLRNVKIIFSSIHVISSIWSLILLILGFIKSKEEDGEILLSGETQPSNYLCSTVTGNSSKFYAVCKDVLLYLLVVCISCFLFPSFFKGAIVPFLVCLFVTLKVSFHRNR